jgi:hypothetical protein
MPETTELQLQDAAEEYLAALGIDIDLSSLSEEEQDDFYGTLDPQVQALVEQYLTEAFPEFNIEVQPMDSLIAIGPPGRALKAAGLVRAAWRAGGARSVVSGAAKAVGAKASNLVQGLLNSRRLIHTGRLGANQVRYVPNRDAAGRFTGGVSSSGSMYSGRTTAGLGAAAERVWDAGTGLGARMVGIGNMPLWQRAAFPALAGSAAATVGLAALGVGQNEEEKDGTDPVYTELQAPGDAWNSELIGLNSLAWENHTVNSGNDKFINWMLDLSMPVGQNISDYGSLTSFLQAQGVAVQDMTTPGKREELSGFFRNNWHQLERLQALVAQVAGERLDEFGAVAVPGDINYQDGALPPEWRDAEEPASPEDIDALTQMLGQGAGPRLISPMGAPASSDQFTQIVESFGRENAGVLMAGVIDEAVDRYFEEFVTRNPYMMGFPGEESGEGVGVFTDFAERSYDGTIGGTVTTLMDLFSGPPGLVVGPAYVAGYLKDLEARDKTPGDGSDKIAQIQQSLYAMGMLADERGNEWLPDEWGFVDDQTIRAFEQFHLDIIVNYREAERLGVDPDVNKIYAEMSNQAVRRMQPENVVDPQAKFKQQALLEIRSGIDSALAERGVSLRSGSDAYLNAVNGVLDDMTKAEKEVAFGQGGTAEDVAAASQILQGFYGGSEEWADNIEFGHMNGNRGFINYANRVGALNQDEMDSLTRYSTSPDHTARMRARLGKDVAVSNFLSYLTDEVGNALPLSSASREQVRNAVVLFGNTIGQGYAKRNALDHRGMRVLADRGFDSMSFTPAEGVTQLLDTAEDRVANAMDIKGRGIGGARYSNLLNVLQNAPARTRRSTVRNV